MRIATVIGNRPQFVKAAAVSGKLRAHHDEVLVHTGQHHDDQLSQIFFQELGIPAPAHLLGLGGGSNLAQTARMLEALEPLLETIAPDAVLVYGDTNSTLRRRADRRGAAAPADPRRGGDALVRPHDARGGQPRPVRPRDRAVPVLDPVAVDNLRGEGRNGVLVGDVMADVALAFAAIAAERATILADQRLVPGEFALLTAHRAGNVDTRGGSRRSSSSSAGCRCPCSSPCTRAPASG